MEKEMEKEEGEEENKVKNEQVKEDEVFEKRGGCVNVGHALVVSGNDALLLCARYAFLFLFLLCLLVILSVCQRAMRLLQHDDFSDLMIRQQPLYFPLDCTTGTHEPKSFLLKFLQRRTTFQGEHDLSMQTYSLVVYFPSRVLTW